jgi:hypothetical protein
MSRWLEVLSHLGATFGLVLTLAGCAAEQPPSGPTSTVDSVLSSTATDLIARTGDYYTQEQTLIAAENTMTNACLALAGFALPPTPATSTSRDEEWRPDAAQRSRTGYGLLETFQQQGNAASSAVDQYVRSLPVDRQRQYESAMFGPANKNAALELGGKRITYPTQGCLAEARTRIYGDDTLAARVFYLPQMYYIDLLNKAHGQPKYTGVIADWSACMRQAGHPYTDQQDAKTQLLARYRSDPDTTATRHLEIAVAVADAECATRSGLGATTEALLREGATKLPSADRLALNDIAAARTTSAGRVAAQLEQPTTSVPASTR